MEGYYSEDQYVKLLKQSRRIQGHGPPKPIRTYVHERNTTWPNCSLHGDEQMDTLYSRLGEGTLKIPVSRNQRSLPPKLPPKPDRMRRQNDGSKRLSIDVSQSSPVIQFPAVIDLNLCHSSNPTGVSNSTQFLCSENPQCSGNNFVNVGSCLWKTNADRRGAPLAKMESDLECYHASLVRTTSFDHVVSVESMDAAAGSQSFATLPTTHVIMSSSDGENLVSKSSVRPINKMDSHNQFSNLKGNSATAIPPPITFSRNYTVVGNQKVYFPQFRKMLCNFADPHMHLTLFKADEIIKAIGFSPRPGHILVSARNLGATISIPQEITEPISYKKFIKENLI